MLAEVRAAPATVVRRRECFLSHASADTHGDFGRELGTALGDLGVRLQGRQQAAARAFPWKQTDANSHHDAVSGATSTAPGRRRRDGRLARREPDAVPPADGSHPARQGHRPPVDHLHRYRAGDAASADGAGTHGRRTVTGHGDGASRRRLLRPLHGARQTLHDDVVRCHHEARRLDRHHAGTPPAHRPDTQVRRAHADVQVRRHVHVPARVRAHPAQAARAEELARVRRLRRDGPARLPAERHRRGAHVRVLPRERTREVYHRRPGG